MKKQAMDKAVARPTERGGTILNVKEAARLIKLGAPMHPVFVHFTIALTASSLVFDVLGFLFIKQSLTAAGGWTLVGSVLITLLTLPTGLTSATHAPIEEGEARSFLRAHMALGFIFYGLLVAVTIWRLSLWQSGRSVSWFYLTAMAFVAMVMTIQGYLGGELVYRYGVEVERSYRELPQCNASSPGPTPISQQESSSLSKTKERGGES